MFHSDFVPTVSGIPPTIGGEKNKTGLIIGITVPVGIVGLVLILSVFYMRRKMGDDDEDGKNTIVGPIC